MKVVPFSKNRQVVYDFLTRARRFHSPVSTGWHVEVERLEASRKKFRVDGRRLSMVACVVKATALVLKAHPRFNHHMFHGLFRKKEVEFDRICCTLIVMRRGPDGERMLFPLLIEDVDQMSIVDIQRTIDRHKYGKLEDLSQMRDLERLKKLPRLALSWFSYKTRSDPKFYRKYFGTYGVSQMGMSSFGPDGGHTIANTASAFLLGKLEKRPVVVRHEVVIRKFQGIVLVADHYVLDGLEMIEGMRTLVRLLNDPEALGIVGTGTEASP